MTFRIYEQATQSHWCIHSLFFFSALLNSNERYTLFILFSALISGRRLIYPCWGEPLPVFVCGTHSQGPTNIMLLGVRFSKGSSLSLCYLLMAHRSPTLTSMGPIRPKKIILALCWKGLHWKAAVVPVLEGMEAARTQLCVSTSSAGACGSAQCSPCSNSSGHDGEQGSGWVTSEKVIKEYGQGWVIMMFCSCLCGRSLELWRS